MSGSGCCAEVDQLPKPQRIHCMNTNPETGVVCNRVAGHPGNHVHCAFKNHKASSWPKKKGDWSGSNLPTVEAAQEEPKKKRSRKRKKKEEEPDPDVEPF